MQTINSLFLGYLIGSISFTQIITKLIKGIDLRNVGSKNVGAMNSIHQIGFKWGIFAGFLDVMKGFGSLWLAQKLSISFPDYYWAGIGALVGHNWPIWLKFQGGKGISVTLGISLFIAPIKTILSSVLGIILIRLNKNNIVLPAAVAFFFLLFLLLIDKSPAEDIFLLSISMAIMLASIIPNYLKLIKNKNGFKNYLRNPNKDYESNES
jgi:acyl phosphate:glycerol-3-phosphate acyltransferase